MEGQQNPWQSETSQGNPYRTDSSDHPPQQNQYQYQPQPQPQSQGWSNPNTSETYNSGATNNNPWQSQPPSQYQAPPVPPPRRTDAETAAILAAQADSGEQIEHMQNYEANKTMTPDERNQAELQRQFPSIDGSLIAAIYSDHKDQRGGQVDMASVRETLQELQS